MEGGRWNSNEQKKAEKGEREKKGGKEGREEKRGREGREEKKEEERGRREAIDPGSGIYSEAELIVEGAGRKGVSRKKGRGKGRKKGSRKKERRGGERKSLGRPHGLSAAPPAQEGGLAETRRGGGRDGKSDFGAFAVPPSTSPRFCII